MKRTLSILMIFIFSALTLSGGTAFAIQQDPPSYYMTNPIVRLLEQVIYLGERDVSGPSEVRSLRALKNLTRTYALEDRFLQHQFRAHGRTLVSKVTDEDLRAQFIIENLSLLKEKGDYPRDLTEKKSMKQNEMLKIVSTHPGRVEWSTYRKPFVIVGPSWLIPPDGYWPEGSEPVMNKVDQGWQHSRELVTSPLQGPDDQGLYSIEIGPFIEADFLNRPRITKVKYQVLPRKIEGGPDALNEVTVEIVGADGRALEFPEN